MNGLLVTHYLVPRHSIHLWDATRNSETGQPGSHNMSQQCLTIIIQIKIKLCKQLNRRLITFSHQILSFSHQNFINKSTFSHKILYRFRTKIMTFSSQFVTFSHQNFVNKSTFSYQISYRFRTKIMTFSPQLVKFSHQNFVNKSTFSHQKKNIDNEVLAQSVSYHMKQHDQALD